MNGQVEQYEASLQWLLEADPDNPGPRYFALRELLNLPEDDPEVAAARAAIMAQGPVPIILDAQQAEGFWVAPGPGYGPKYRGTVWQIIFLAQLGADGGDSRVRAGCQYVLAHSRSRHGGFSATGTPSGMVHCLEGNLCAAMIDLGWLGDARLDEALDWLARSVTGRGIAPSEERSAEVRYLRSGNSGPGFRCSANDQLPCAWGAVKVMLALSKVPAAERTPAMVEAIETGLAFLFSVDPATADYPMGYSNKPNNSWFKFGYPIGYVTDVLQNLEALVALGYRTDPRLKPALEMLLSKRDQHGRWLLEYTYNGKTWVDVGAKGQPSKWVTLRALRVLKG
ncbi:MAG: nitrogen fixation protein NifH, partial [Chloroflexota bacterium]